MRHASAALLCVVACTAGCEPMAMRMQFTARQAAEGTAPVLEDLQLDLQKLGDPQMLRSVAAANLLRAERAAAAAPNHVLVRTQACRSFVSYGYGFMEADWRALEDAEAYDEADVMRARIERIYLRAKAHCYAALRAHSTPFDEALAAGSDALLAHVQERYVAQRHAAPLFWTALAWARSLQFAEDGMEGAGDLTPIRVLARRAVELHPEYQNGSPLALLAGLHCAIPDALGGDSKTCRKLFMEAIAATERKNLGLLVAFARNYALTVEDEELYRSLLKEVAEAPDHGDTLRLTNELARRDALYFLAHADDVFY